MLGGSKIKGLGTKFIFKYFRLEALDVEKTPLSSCL